MTEAISKNDLRDAALIDPFQIGAGGEKPKRLIPFLNRPQHHLTEQEINDLAKIDQGKIGLEDIKEYAADHLFYYEHEGKVRRNPMREKDFREAKKVFKWLKEEKYHEAAAFFLSKAREEWRGVESNKGNGEISWRVMEMEEVATVPQEVVLQGDSAINNFIKQKDLGFTLRMASKTPAVYLRQASVLARIIIDK